MANVVAEVVHGLLQKARKDAEALPYKFCPGGKGVRLWRRYPVGWAIVGELITADDAEDFLMSKLTQEER